MSKTKKESRVLFYILSFTWGIFWTLVGLIILPFVLLLFGKKAKIEIIRGRICVILDGYDFGGISLGLVVVVDEYDQELIDHEIGHTIQNAWFGPLFLFLVAIPSGIRYQLWDKRQEKYFKKHGEYLDYDSVWFERQATKLGQVYK